MAAKFVVVLALAAVAQCSVVPVAPLVRADADYSSFAYDVADPNTGDYKSQVETRVGGAVSGQYSLLDSDGTKRTVDYTADDVNGFNAVVRKDPVYAAAPVVAAGPAVVEARTYAAGPVVAQSYAAAPVVAQTYAANPVFAQTYAAAPVGPHTYAATPIGAHTYAAAPAVYAASSPVYAARAYAAPSVYSYNSPVVAARTVGSPYYAYANPAVSYW